MRNALEGFNGGVKFGGKKITNLRYADDTPRVDLLNRIKQASEEKDLLLNTNKTKNGRKRVDAFKIVVLPEAVAGVMER